MSHRNFDWTPEKVALLTQLWNTGLPTTEIGLKLGCTKNAVISKAHRLKLKRRRPINVLRSAIVSDSLYELAENTCRWPVGNPGESDFHFCGETVVEGKSYCRQHYEIAYLKRSGHSVEIVEEMLRTMGVRQARLGFYPAKGG